MRRSVPLAPPPPAAGHPLGEGDSIRCGYAPIATHQHAQNVPLNEGVANGRGRLSGEAHEPLSTYRALYNPLLRANADDLRKRMTKAESCLWKYVLRARQMKGYTFNRQRPVLRYVADFMCKPLQLIIEVDGSSHDDPKVKKHDAFRQNELEASGFTVLRFTNQEVLSAIGSVRSAIARKVDDIEQLRHSEEQTGAQQ